MATASRRRSRRPVYTEKYFDDGPLAPFPYVEYRKNGKLHHGKGPAVIVYDTDYADGYFHGREFPGVYEVMYYRNGKLHRDDGAAVITYRWHSTEEYKYYKHGKLHRVDGPAHVKFGSFGFKHYYIDGKLHREDGPAVIEYGTKDRVEENIIHRKHYIHGEFVKDDGYIKIVKCP